MRVLLSVLFSAHAVFAQFSPREDSLIQAGINQIYSIKFNEAYETFAELQRISPENPAGEFFGAMVLWWQILIDLREERFDELFYTKLEKVIEKCDEILEEKPDDYFALFFKVGALGFRGRLLSVRQEWLDAALDGKDALPIVLKIANLYPEDPDINLGLGLYNYYAEVIPKFYPFIEPLMYLFPKGNKELGLQQLISVADSGRYAKYETQYFLLQIYFEFEKDNDKAYYYCKRLLDKFPDNPKFENYLGRIYYRTRRFALADSVFGSIKNKIDKEKRGYNTPTNMRSDYYYLGAIAYRDFNRTDEAISLFEKSLKISEKIDGENYSGFMKHTYKYLVKLYKRKNNFDKANYYSTLLKKRFGEKG